MDKGKGSTSFSTLDSYIAAYLSLNGHDPLLVNQAGRIAFVFERTDALRRCLEDFTAGALVKASEYVFEVKALKSRIHETRRENGYGQEFSRTSG